VKLSLPNITLLAADTTPKARLAAVAIERSLEQCSFGAVKLLTNDMSLPYAVEIPRIEGLEGYSRFCIKQMAKHVETPFALVCQADGYVLNSRQWTPMFTQHDYCGAPFNPSGAVGNGGFSLRSKRLLDYMANAGWTDDHPEDSAICIRHRAELQSKGFKIAPTEVARLFAMEGRSWNSKEWQGTPNRWGGEFGFHSWLTPGVPNSPNVFHHSLDAGDCVYAAAVMKAIGGGVLFISTDNRYPYPLNSRWSRMGGPASAVDNLKPLLEAQDYIDRVSFTHGLPFSTTHDLNKFREPWKARTAKDNWSILKLHLDAFGVSWPEDMPWLTVDDPIVIPDRPIVVARSPRYQNMSFPWFDLVQKWGHLMAFVGTEEEAHIFQGFGAPKFEIPWHRTENALDLARVIAGARVCVMNQSLPLAIAHGLCKRVVVEEWPKNPNCRLIRDGAIYNTPEIPESWLK
jgi:hypothetical protein